MENVIEVQHLSKSFGNHEVLKDIDFSVKKEKLFVLLVPLDQVNRLFFGV